jgi:hypothetical protein
MGPDRNTNAVIRIYDEAGYVIETHQHAGDFKGNEHIGIFE